MSRSDLRVGIVGAGLMGRYHADAAVRAGGSLVAIVDPRLEQARRLADGAPVAQTLEALDAGVDLDVVHVCAPLAEHVPIAKEALARGAHLVVEKPLAPDGATTAALLSQAAEQGSVVVPVHQFLFQPGVQRLLEGRDRLGSIVRCVFEAATAGAEVTALDPDALVADILPHPLALFTRLAGNVSELEWVVLRPAAGELRALAAPGETTFEIVISTRGRPTRTTLDVVGTAASGHADLYHGFSTVERGSGTGLGKIARPFAVASSTLGRAGTNLTRRAVTREFAYPGLRELVRQTYDAIRAGSPPPIPAHEALEVARARDAIVRAVLQSPR